MTWNSAFAGMMWLVVFILQPQMAHAADAADCIDLGEDKAQKSRTLKNTCSNEVMLFWCHDNTAKAHSESACDTNKRVYRQQTPLKPGEIKVNRYSLPAGSTLTFGACYGSYGSFAILDNAGNYLCFPQRVSSTDSQQKWLHTRKGDDIDTTCAEAKDSAKAYGSISECSCESRGKIAICRVESIGKFSEDSRAGMIADAKRLLREALKNQEGTCAQSPCETLAYPFHKLRQNGGPGRRG